MQAGLTNDSVSYNEFTAINASSATTDQSSGDCINLTGKGVRVTLTTTAVGTASLTLHIQAKDVATSTYADLLVGTAVTTNTSKVYVVYPTLTPSANAIAQDVVPHTFLVKVVHGNGNAATYTVGCSILQ